MSGPVEPQTGPVPDLGISTIEVKEGRNARIGDLNVVRVLPTKNKRTIGPWCFVDLMSPEDVEKPPPMEIGPHPHIGLATVTWLFAGSALHSDSLGTEQMISPGELNLMSAGHGVAHAELGIETSPAHETGGIMGAQMWLAQPEATRHGPSRFEHLDSLPLVDLDGGRGHLFIGEIAGARSPAATDHDTVGVDIVVDDRVTLPAQSGFEYAVVPIDRPMRVEDAIVEPGALAFVPPGYDQLRIATRSGTGRVLVLGGRPLGEGVKMWWNFVARTTEELTEAWEDWEERNEARFGPVPSDLPRIDAPRPPWLRPDPPQA